MVLSPTFCLFWLLDLLYVSLLFFAIFSYLFENRRNFIYEIFFHEFNILNLFTKIKFITEHNSKIINKFQREV